MSDEPEMVVRVARAIWERRSGGNWDARMSWTNPSPELRAAKIAAGTHPDNFDYNIDLDDSFADARAAIEAMREPTPAMVAAASYATEAERRANYVDMIDDALHGDRV